jgi:glycosyltransferase involved in cell wall biosynthesis
MERSINVKLLILESHPIQYRAPVYERIEQICPGTIHVAYASDFSIRGGRDPGFGGSVSWDGDLLAGYPSTILRTDLKAAPQRWGELDGRGVSGLLERLRPQAILLNSLNYRFGTAAYAYALMRGIPVWMRTETQDHAFARSRLKSALRSFYYRLLYAGIQQAFPIGKLNRQHWLSHGLKPHQLRHHMHYCTVDRAGELSEQARLERRVEVRDQMGVVFDQIVVAFFGKLIPKKNPDLLFQSLAFMPALLRQRIHFLFVGSGEQQDTLKHDARVARHRYDVPTFFPGFVNQSGLVDWYLAADLVVLPSRQAGETWGLVANEALQAGCSVIVSDAVGCATDFGGWERVRTIPVGSAESLSAAIHDLSAYTRSFTWAADHLKKYSIEAAAHSLAAAIAELT